MTYHPDLISTSAKMFTVLVILVGGLLIVFYYAKRKIGSQTRGSKGRLIKVLGNTYIGVKKQIALVEIPGAVLVLGVSNDNISLLARIDDDETLENLKVLEGTKPFPSFSDQLQKISSRFKGHKNRI
jgi:flagellar protein FliO/FliZ